MVRTCHSVLQKAGYSPKNVKAENHKICSIISRIACAIAFILQSIVLPILPGGLFCLGDDTTVQVRTSALLSALTLAMPVARVTLGCGCDPNLQLQNKQQNKNNTHCENQNSH